MGQLVKCRQSQCLGRVGSRWGVLVCLCILFWTVDYKLFRFVGMDGRKNGQTDGGPTDGRVDGQTDIRTDKQTDNWTAKRASGQTERQTDRSRDGQRNKRMDGKN